MSASDTHYILIDYENVPVKSLALLKGDRFRVGVFLGPKNTRLATEFVLALVYEIKLNGLEKLVRKP